MTACSTEQSPVVEQSSSSIASSAEEIQETKNVSYRGTLEELGPSIYQQGTHMLSLGDGRMIILESTLVDFTPFIGVSVEVFGALRPTVEAGGLIMRVEQITSLDAGSASSISSSSSSISSLPLESSAESAVPVASSVNPIASAPSPEKSSKSFSSLTASSTVPSSVTNASSSIAVTSLEPSIIAMAKEDISDARWTQLYCSSHLKFCVPIHKNWWFVSFGSNADTLWHLEVSNVEFEALDSGPIHLDVIGGDIASVARSDGEVRISGTTITGFRSWTQGRHIEISADARLEGAIKYMTSHLRAAE